MTGPWSQAVKVLAWEGRAGKGFGEQKQRSLQLSGVTEVISHISLKHGGMSCAACIIPV